MHTIRIVRAANVTWVTLTARRSRDRDAYLTCAKPDARRIRPAVTLAGRAARRVTRFATLVLFALLAPSCTRRTPSHRCWPAWAPTAARSRAGCRLRSDTSTRAWRSRGASIRPSPQRAFAAAAAADPRCALCWWGAAWAAGPTINADMTADDAARVHAALVQAIALAPRASPRDRALIEALAARHPAIGAPSAVDEAAYAQRMRALARAYPRDADIAVLAAEALLNLHPYDWWASDGSPQPWTGEIQALLLRGDGDRTPASRRQSLLDSPDGVFASAGGGPRERTAACERGSGLGASAAHAGAYRHAHRPLCRRRGRQRAGDRGGRALPRGGRCAGGLPRRLRRAQPSLPVGCGGDGRAQRDCPGGRARRVSGGLRTRAQAIAAPASSSITTCCRSSRSCGSDAGGRFSRTRCRRT